MSLFNDLWQLLRAHGSSAKRETECAALWSTYPPQTQQRIYDTIRTKRGTIYKRTCYPKGTFPRRG